ncbi:MAG: universal stress protein [Thermodesulfovibrionales bacterium]
MKKILIAVDEFKGSKRALEVFLDMSPRVESVVLLNVQQLGGRSAMHYISDTDWSTLNEMLSKTFEGSDVKEAMDRKSEMILGYAKKFLEDHGVSGIKTLVKRGYAAEEIINAAREEGADMIIIGSRGKRMHSLLLGSVSREVANSAEIPVLIAR